MECIVNLEDYPINSTSFAQKVREELQQESIVTLPTFLQPDAIRSLINESLEHQHLAYFSNSTHNIYFTPNDPSLPPYHSYNRQSLTSRGCTTTDQIPNESILKELYYNPSFQKFLCRTLEVEQLHPHGDPMSSITVHYGTEGKELGWHFDSSAFAITLLLQKPEEGGVFEYLPNIRERKNGSNGNDNASNSSTRSNKADSSFLDSLKEGMEEEVQNVLDGKVLPKRADLNPGTLVIFRGRNSLHRVTKVAGNTTRILVVFAYNEKPGIRLDKERMLKHFGRVC